MASRERKRTERQKRKARSSGRRAEVAARYEERNQAAREALEPLTPTERPVVVTVGAVISGLVALSVLVAYAAGATVNGDRPHLLQVIIPALLMGAMAIGMWRVRYWAVLGFQAVLALLLLGASLGLLSADGVAPVIGERGPDRSRGNALLLHDQGDGPDPDAHARAGVAPGARLAAIGSLIESGRWPRPTTSS